MWVALIPAAYLLGMFPSAVIVARASRVDITTIGSGNPGASNVARVLGWRKGALVLVLDAAKGAIAALIGLLARGWDSGPADPRVAGYALGAAAIVGHVFPVTRRFRGGKGVATVTGAPAWEFAATVGLVALVLARHLGDAYGLLRGEEASITRQTR
jgi:acyl phosphate:glycerol-3-phosphate acyltransferase